MKNKVYRISFFFIFLLCVVFSVGSIAAEKDGETGLVTEKGYKKVRAICTECHSAQLITQNRADRTGWLEMIRWMQAEQGMDELEAETEKVILDYLAANYGPLQSFRRPPLSVEWK